MSARRLLLTWSAAFYGAVGVLAVLIGLRYVVLYPLPRTVLGVVYVGAASVSHFLLMGFLPWLLVVMPLASVLPARRVVVPVAVVLASAVLSLLLLDSLVYAENRFHINPLTVSILGWKTWGFGLVYALIFCAFTGLLAFKLWRMAVSARLHPPWIALATLTAFMLAFTHGAHMWADANCYTPVTAFTPYLPFFYPATARRVMIRWGWASLSETRRETLGANGRGGDMVYPLRPLDCRADTMRQHLLVILLDGWRWDALDTTVTPSITRYAANGMMFRNHWSGGNSTRAGVFTFFYGLPAPYWKYFDGMHRQPLLIQELLCRGYRTGIFSSGPLYAPANLDASVFAGIANLRMKTVCPIDATWARDSAITDEWRAWRASLPREALFFGFLFYGNPVDKSTPPGYRWTTMAPQDTLSALGRKIARYQAALRYTDSLVGVVLDDLAASGELERTVVFISADHGEGFDSAGLGFRGHGNAFNAEQLRVPLVVLWPGRAREVVSRRTSHFDIAPTILRELLGCPNPASDYCSGTSLFSEDQWDWFVAGSYYNTAIVEPHRVTVQFPGGYYEVRDSLYRLMARPHIDRGVLTAAMIETGRFFRP